MRTRQTVLGFCDQLSGGSNVNARGARDLHSQVLTEVAQADLDDLLKHRFKDLLDAALEAHLSVLRSSEPGFSVLSQQSRALPSLAQSLARRRVAIDGLRALAHQLDGGKVRPDGYTAGELKSEAEIGKDLWQTIRRAADIESRRGNSQHRFSNREILRLIDAAREHGTVKAKAAGDLWDRLLERNRGS